MAHGPVYDFDVSVIICTRNRARSLTATLQSLIEDVTVFSREVVIIDNGSTDETPDIIHRVRESTDMPIRHLIERRPGHSNARNRGVAEARGRFLLFTDDDVTVRPGWTNALVEGFASGAIAVGGRVIPVPPGPVPAWMNGPQLGQVALTDYGPDYVPMCSSKAMLPFGANFGIHRGVLRDPCPFHTSLGHTGRMSIGWEEWHFLERLEAAGHKIVYAPQAVAEHHFDAHRLSWPAVRRAHFQNGFGLSRHRRLMGGLRTPAARRIARATKAYWLASRHRLRNAHRATPTPEQANQEFVAYRLAGECLESVLWRFPRVNEWAGTHLA